MSHGQIISLSQLSGRTPIHSQCQYLADENHELTLEDILTDSMQGQFREAPEEVLNYGEYGPTLWLKIEVAAPTDQVSQPWVLEVAYPFLGYGLFYSRQPDGTWLQAQAGSEIPFDSITNRSPAHIFLLPSPPEETATYYLKIGSRRGGVIQGSIFLTPEGAYRDYAERKHLYLGAFFGALLIMLVYNLFLAVSVRSVTYLLYCLFLGFHLVNRMALMGYLSYLTEGWFSNGPVVSFTLRAYYLAATFFAIRFLRTRRTMPRWHTVIMAFVAIQVVFLLLYFISGPHPLFIVMVPPVCIVLLISGVIALRRGRKEAKYYLAGWTLFLIGLIVYAGKTMGVFPATEFIEYVTLPAVLLEVLMFSFALADRINVYRFEKQEAQARALDIATQKENLLAEQNALLEQGVKTRTQELQKANDLMRNQQEELIAQNERLQQQQEEIEAINQNLEYTVVQRTRKIAEAHQQIVDFAFMNAHELRGPLARVLGLNYLMKLGAVPPGEVPEILAKIDESAEEMDQVVKKITRRLEKSEVLNRGKERP